MPWEGRSYWSAEDVSRLYVSDKERAPWQIAGTFALNLTQHWLESRCPLFTREEKARAVWKRPGAWVVAGICEFAFEMNFDERRRTCDPEKRLATPYCIPQIPDSSLLPWKTVLTATAVDQSAFKHDLIVDLQAPFRLGVPLQFAQSDIFEFQSSLLCQYLFLAEDGRRREQLWRYVGAYFRGEDTDVRKWFGVDEDELARRALRFAADYRSR
jgi:hypothetical protein